MSSDYIIREFVKPINVLCVIYDLVLFPGNFFNIKRNWKIYSFLGFEFFFVLSLYDFYKIYMILVWLLRNHTNHIWPCMTTKNCVWWATRNCENSDNFKNTFFKKRLHLVENPSNTIFIVKYFLCRSINYNFYIENPVTVIETIWFVWHILPNFYPNLQCNFLDTDAWRALKIYFKHYLPYQRMITHFATSSIRTYQQNE